MKKILNTGKAACLITVILMAAGFILGGTRPLSRMKGENTNLFFTGTENSGPNSFNMMDDLRAYSGLAANALVVAGRYFDDNVREVAEFRRAREQLDMAINNSISGPDLRADRLKGALNALHVAAHDLERIMVENSSVSPSDASLFRGNATDMDSLHTIMTRQGEIFNNHARNFNDILNRGPASLFRIIGLVRPMYLFYND